MGDRIRSANKMERTAAAVKAFYERHPYPPAVSSLERYREHWNDPGRRRADYHLFEPTKPFNPQRSILIAGCGTSQAAKYAVRWPEAAVTGIDVSKKSIAESEALKRKYDLENLTLVQLPVEQAGELSTSFDYIISTGVLHHLPDPELGLRALRNVLHPDGSMHIMVYAPYGRAGIYQLQEYHRRIGIDATRKEILGVAETLRALPKTHPLVPLISSSPDFANEAALADALLHPQDRPFSVEQFFDFLDSADLQFGRWLRQAPYLPCCGALASTPHRERIERLSLAEQYAVVELFRGTMVRHSAVVYRNDLPRPPQPIDFRDNAWQTYVPIRVPDAVQVRERLPEGAAAVLINSMHTDTDIYLPVDLNELDIYEAIDGVRSAGTLAAETCGAREASKLLETLWYHDQIVFDASGAAS